jgi:8-oxo-dGTP pyrophosphatase MutT (NUDIX family)
VTLATIGTVDAYVLRRRGCGWEVLVLQRAAGTRCTGAWEVVHGLIEPGERPEQAAIREVREETGLDVERLYNVTVQHFYLHGRGAVAVAVVFAALVGPGSEVTLGPEHQRGEWVGVPEALERFAWPRSRAALADIVALLRGGDAGPVEDVLRVR